MKVGYITIDLTVTQAEQFTKTLKSDSFKLFSNLKLVTELQAKIDAERKNIAAHILRELDLV